MKWQEEDFLVRWNIILPNFLSSAQRKNSDFICINTHELTHGRHRLILPCDVNSIVHKMRYVLKTFFLFLFAKRASCGGFLRLTWIKKLLFANVLDGRDSVSCRLTQITSYGCSHKLAEIRNFGYFHFCWSHSPHSIEIEFQFVHSILVKFDDVR